MTTKKCIIVKLSALLFAFNTDVALAADTDSSSMLFPGWPLAALFIVLIVFRKKLFAEASVQPLDEPEHNETPAPTKETVPAAAKSKPVTKTKAATKVKPAAKAKAKPAAKAKPSTTKSKSVSLITDSTQCQASTAKGTRCKRTSTLEKASVSIEGTKYQLTVCKQHNNDTIKPFSELLK